VCDVVQAKVISLQQASNGTQSGGSQCMPAEAPVRT